MISSILTTIAIALLAAAPSDREHIQGAWKLVLRDGDRMWFDPELSFPFTITTFRGDERITDEAEKRDTFVLHPDRKPKAIELHSRDVEGRPTTHVGAYELEGDTLKLCLRYGTDELPPPGFGCKPGPDRMFWVLKRVKPGDPPEPVPAEVVIADEHRPEGDPTEVKVAVANKSESTISISFEPQMHFFFFQFRLYDEQGQPVKLPPAYNPELLEPKGGRVRIRPGETATGYLSPRVDYQIPPGRYQVEVDYYYGRVSNRVTKVFP